VCVVTAAQRFGEQQNKVTIKPLDPMAADNQCTKSAHSVVVGVVLHRTLSHFLDFFFFLREN
jgi:hypothetical protein